MSLFQPQTLAVARANEFVQNAAPPEEKSPERTAFTPIPAHLRELVADNQENIRQGKGLLYHCPALTLWRANPPPRPLL